MPQLIMPAIEHHYANSLLKETEDAQGYIEVYSIVIDPESIVRSNHISNDAKAVTVDGVRGFLVVDQNEDYLRPDFVSEDALIKKPVMIKKITPNADKEREEKKARAAKIKEGKERAIKQEKKDKQERIARHNKAQLINEGISNFNEICDSSLPLLTGNESLLVMDKMHSAIEKAFSLIDKSGVITARFFNEEMTMSNMSHKIEQVEFLTKNGFLVEGETQNDIFTLKITDENGNSALEYQSKLTTKDVEMNVYLDESTPKTFNIPIDKVDIDNPIVHLEFGRDFLNSPEKSFFINRVDVLNGLEDANFYSYDRFNAIDLEENVFENGVLALNELEQIALLDYVDMKLIARKIEVENEKRLDKTVANVM